MIGNILYPLLSVLKDYVRTKINLGEEVTKEGIRGYTVKELELMMKEVPNQIQDKTEQEEFLSYLTKAPEYLDRILDTIFKE